MVARKLVCITLLFAGAVLLTAPGPAAAEATQPKGSKAAAKPNAFRVQVRHPKWKRFAVRPSLTAATADAARLRRQGWNAQVRRPRPGVFVVRAKIARWRQVAVVGSRPLANNLAARARAKGFQARVVPFHR